MGFFIPDQELAKTIEPGITGLHYPAAAAISGNSFLGLGLHAFGNDAGQILSRQHTVMGTFAEITFIRIQSHGRFPGALGSLQHYGIQDCIYLGDIMPLRPGDDEGQRDTMPVYQHVAFAAVFPPDRWGWAPPPLGPMGLWLWQNQCSARTRRCLPSHRIPLSRHARWPKRLPPAPTSENRHALNWDCQTSPWARPSTGSRCGEHTQFPQKPGDSPRAFALHPPYDDKVCVDPWWERESSFLPAPKTCRTHPMKAPLAYSPPNEWYSLGANCAIFINIFQVKYG